MKLDEYLKEIPKQLSAYVHDFAEILVSPFLSGISLREVSGFHHTLWIFLFISIFIGSSLASVTPLKARESLEIVIPVVIAHWFVVTVYAHLICRFLTNRSAIFVITANCVLRVAAVTYVLSAICALLLSTVLGTNALTTRGLDSAQFLIIGLGFWGIQCFILPSYLGLVLAGAYRLATWKTVLLVTFVVVAVTLAILIPALGNHILSAMTT